MKDELRFKCLSVGMSGPKAIEEEPIRGNHLYAMPPGKSLMVCLFEFYLVSF